MKPIILIIQILVAVGLIGLIMLQSSKGGLGAGFGGAEFYRTKRGAERIVFSATILFGILFLFASILNLIIK
jgi:preprotein translocase subunit SecG